VGTVCLAYFLTQSSKCREADGGKEAEGASLTSNSHHSLRFLASDEEDDVALRRVDIVVLKEEGLVDAIFLERRKLDKQVQRACESFL